MASTALGGRLLKETRSRSLNYGSTAAATVTFPESMLLEHGTVAAAPIPANAKDKNGCIRTRTESRCALDGLRFFTDLPVSMFGGIGGRYLLLLALSSFLLIQMVAGADFFGALVQRLCAVLVTVFAMGCLFYLLTIYLRNAWTNTSIYVLFLACFGGDVLLGRWLRSSGAEDEDPLRSGVDYLRGPALTTGVLSAVGVASMFSSLETGHSTLIIVVVSFVRFLAGAMLTDLPEGMRPLVAYASAVVGVFGARFTETAFMHSVTSPTVAVTTIEGATPNFVAHGKVEMIKRRRSSSAVPNSFTSHLVGRRISLPLLMQKSVMSTVSVDSALLREADGILTDMMADPSLPRHLLSGLRAVSNMLKPVESHAHGGHRSKISPLVSLSEAALSGPEYSEWPHSDRLSYLPKKFRRSLPPSLIRSRSSTSTWTTTTSATGMPTLESEPVHRGKVIVGRDGSLIRISRHAMSIANLEFDGSISPSGNDLAELIYHSLEESGKSDHQREDGKSSGFHPGSEKHPVLTEDVEEGEAESWRPSEPLVRQTSISSSSMRRTSTPLHISFVENESETVFAIDDKEKEANPEHSKLTEENLLKYISDEVQTSDLLEVRRLTQWDYPIFDLSARADDTVLSRIVYKTFVELGFLETFNIPVYHLLNYFHALELGYHNKPYHNRIHAADVLHAVFYITTQPIPGFVQVTVDEEHPLSHRSTTSTQDKDIVISENCVSRAQLDASYGIMAANFPPLELMALYTAAAMHDYDHPGRTNAFLVSTCSPLAILYNDRSVLECHHAASAWALLLSDQRNAWLSNLDNSEFKRFRFLVIEAILATDLKQHFELLSEFNSKVNDEDAVGIDWSCEADRLMVGNMVIKMSDINGPCKRRDLHMRWTERICEEFYEQGDEEAKLGLPISPYMDRKNPQLAKLQESFINHLVSPLCSAMANAGLLPGSIAESTTADNSENEETTANDLSEEELDDEAENSTASEVVTKDVVCCLVKNLESNIEMWIKVIEEENGLNDKTNPEDNDITPENLEEVNSSNDMEMEPITEEDSTINLGVMPL